MFDNARDPVKSTGSPAEESYENRWDNYDGPPLDYPEKPGALLRILWVRKKYRPENYDGLDDDWIGTYYCTLGSFNNRHDPPGVLVIVASSEFDFAHIHARQIALNLLPFSVHDPLRQTYVVQHIDDTDDGTRYELQRVTVLDYDSVYDPVYSRSNGGKPLIDDAPSHEIDPTVRIHEDTVTVTVTRDVGGDDE